MQRVKIAIYDDDTQILDQLRHNIMQYQKTKNDYLFLVSCHENLNDMNEFDFDILFLDIFFGEKKSGLEAIKALRKMGSNAYVAFISSFKDYDISKIGFQLDVVDYISKPFSYQEIAALLDRILLNMSKEQLNGSRLIIKYDGITNVVNVKDIVFIDIESRKRRIHMRDHVVLSTLSLQNIFQQLPDTIFAYTHNAFIVNLKFVDYCSIDNVYMIDGNNIPLSRSHKVGFMEKLNGFAYGRREGL